MYIFLSFFYLFYSFVCKNFLSLSYRHTTSHNIIFHLHRSGINIFFFRLSLHQTCTFSHKALKLFFFSSSLILFQQNYMLHYFLKIHVLSILPKCYHHWRNMPKRLIRDLDTWNIHLLPISFLKYNLSKYFLIFLSSLIILLIV